MLCSLLLLQVTVAIENLASCCWILCSWSYGCVTLQHQNLHDFSQLLLENRRRKQTSQKLKVIRDFRKTCIRPKLSVTYICIPLVRVLWRVLPVLFLVLDTDQPPVPCTSTHCAGRPQCCVQEGGCIGVLDVKSASCCHGCLWGQPPPSTEDVWIVLWMLCFSTPCWCNGWMGCWLWCLCCSVV